MGDEKEFRERIHKIGALVQQIDNIADPALRANAKELVQLLMELHGSGLERLLELIFQSGENGSRIIDQLGRDPLVSSLLILYGLHPEDLQTRVERRLEQIRPALHKLGADVRVVTAEDGNIRIHASVEGHACGSTTKSVQGAVEEAIYEAAPDLKSLAIEGLDHPTASGFIAMESLLATLPAPHGDGMD